MSFLLKRSFKRILDMHTFPYPVCQDEISKNRIILPFRPNNTAFFEEIRDFFHKPPERLYVNDTFKSSVDLYSNGRDRRQLVRLETAGFDDGFSLEKLHTYENILVAAHQLKNELENALRGESSIFKDGRRCLLLLKGIDSILCVTQIIYDKHLLYVFGESTDTFTWPANYELYGNQPI
jgi:hypothetical protein